MLLINNNPNTGFIKIVLKDGSYVLGRMLAGLNDF